jgi:hypothetical protein
MAETKCRLGGCGAGDAANPGVRETVVSIWAVVIAAGGLLSMLKGLEYCATRV